MDISPPWNGDKQTFYVYLILLELVAILIMFGYFIYLYWGFSYQPRYQSSAPPITGIREMSQEKVGAEEGEAAPSPELVELEQNFSILESAIQNYFAENLEYPPSLEVLVGDYIGADEFDDVFIYYVNKERNEFEINLDLGPEGAELMAQDGGNDPDLYELGTDLTIK